MGREGEGRVENVTPDAEQRGSVSAVSAVRQSAPKPSGFKQHWTVSKRCLGLKWRVLSSVSPRLNHVAASSWELG